MHLLNPISKTRQNESPNNGVISIEGVTATTEIRVVTEFGLGIRLLLGNVVGRVLETLETEGRADFVALSRMVVYDVQDDFDACAVQGLHHVSEFVQHAKWIGRCSVTRMGSK